MSTHAGYPTRTDELLERRADDYEDARALDRELWWDEEGWELRAYRAGSQAPHDPDEDDDLLGCDDPEGGDEPEPVRTWSIDPEEVCDP